MYIRSTQYTIDQQPPLDDDQVKKVFRKHSAELTKLMSVFINRWTVAVELYSEELITEACHDEAVAVGIGPHADRVKGTILATSVRDTINSQPQLITKLISVLKKIETFNSLANKLSLDLCL